MKLSLSVRVAESRDDKRKPAMSLESLAGLAAAEGYSALCMRASQIGVHTPVEVVREKRHELSKMGLAVSMATGDFPIPENTDEAPNALRNITPYLDLADALGADLLRIGMKTEEDVRWAQRACDEAGERGMRLAHQCHTASLFEQVGPSLDVIERVGRRNFGVIYEPANLATCGEEYGLETIKRFSPHLFNVYFQNSIVRPGGRSTATTWCRGEVRSDQVSMWGGEGIDFPAIMAALEGLGYAGYVTLHQAATPPTSTEEFARETARCLKALATIEG